MKRETAQTVPPAGALSVHGEIPDTLQAKPLPEVLQRAERLGHRAGTTFEVVQRSKFTGHAPGEMKTIPSAILAAAFGGGESYRLKALSRQHEKQLQPLGLEGSHEEKEEEEEDQGVDLWLHGSQLPKQLQVERAGKVTATLEGPRRIAGSRKSDPLQTLIGSLGEMERSILGRGPSKSYEGGHLIGDQFLDQESYVPWNLAPQSRGLNSPYYRQVEAMLAIGPIDKTTLTPNVKVPIHVEVEVKYPDDPYSVTVKDLESRQVITPKAAKTRPPEETIAVPRFVPSEWALTASIDPAFEDDYILPTTEVTPLMQKSTGVPSLVRIPSQEHIATPHPLNTTFGGGQTFGGGKSMKLGAQQHYPHPETPAKGTKLDLGTLLAPRKQQTRLSRPVNLLARKDHETILDDLGNLSEALGENPSQDSASWSAIAYYVTEAAAKSGAKDRNDLLEAAVRVYQKGLQQFSKISVKGEMVDKIRLKLRQLLFYDSFLTLSEDEKMAAPGYDEVENMSASAYVEDDEEIGDGSVMGGGSFDEEEEEAPKLKKKGSIAGSKRKDLEDPPKKKTGEAQLKKLATTTLVAKTEEN